MEAKYFVPLILALYGLRLVNSHHSIPFYLRECYQNDTFNGPKLPMSLKMLIEIIRRAEKSTETSLNIRTMSSALLHRFKFDGIEYHSNVKVKEGVLPFGGTGSQRSKNHIVEELVPGNPDVFPAQALSLEERCSLHRAISNTIWEHMDAKKDKMCTDQVTEKLSDEAFSIEPKTCPIEYGVVLTPFGTIAPGTVIAAIAAALQPQNITLRLLLEKSDPKYPDDRLLWLKVIERSTTHIDNVWVATLAGELAEMTVYQGPVGGTQMELGATGFWNSSMRPTIFYLFGRDGTFDLTRAEMVGAIDGFIIAKKLPNWLSKFENLRLSQVLEMYYTNKGSAFDSGIRACDRGKVFWNLAPKSVLEEQTYAISQILAYRRSVAYMDEAVLMKMAKHAVRAVNSYTMHNLFTEENCRKSDRISPMVEALVVFDGAWSKDYTADFLSVIADDFDVSIFGSKMGMMHGTTGEWLLNVTDSLPRVHYTLETINNFTWPVGMNFDKVLQNISAYLDRTWREKRSEHIVGGLGQLIVFLAPRVAFNAVDRETILKLIRNVKDKHPDVHFLYYVSEGNAPLFRPFLITNKDHLIQNSRIAEITNVALTVSRVLRPAECNSRLDEGVRDQFEDYVVPRKSVLYRLHPFWRRNTKKVTVSIHNFAYGTIEICTWNQRKNNVRQDNYHCRSLSGHSETTFVDYAICGESGACNTTHYQITGVSSRKQCAEFNCRSPDHIRYVIRLENLYCSIGSHLSPPFFLLALTSITFSRYF